jgi:hypothetical protein
MKLTIELRRSSSRPDYMTTRTEAEAVDCPRCRALAGEACQGKRGARVSMHAERHQAVRRGH